MSTSRLNVLIIAQYFPPDLGGAATRAYNAAKGLTMNGCKVTVVTAFPHYPHGKISNEYKWRLLKVEWHSRIKVIRSFIIPLESKGLSSRFLLFASFAISSLFALLLVGRTDVIWVANPDILSLMPAIAYKKVKRRPIASNVDDLVLEDLYDLKLIKKGSLISRAGELIARICYMKAEAVTPISPGYIEAIRKFGVIEDRIHIVGGGVDLKTFTPGTSLRNSSKFRILYSGAFSIAYDFEQLLEAARILDTKDCEVEFILQGKGELASRISSGIKRLGLRNVRIIDQILSRQEVAELLNQADALILPLADFGKPYRGMSSKLYEFQAVSKPIICCAKGQPADYVKETRSGIVVEPGDCGSIAQAILYLKENPAVAKNMGESGRRYVEENMSLQKIGLTLKLILMGIAPKGEVASD